MTDPTTAVLLPMQLTAWVLNKQCCQSKNYKIGPLTQPNYTFLRLNENLLTSDTLDHVDIHSASPADRNARVWDLGSDTIRSNRLGVYLHWTLPQLYRRGMAAAGEAAKSDDQRELKRMQGYPTSSAAASGDINSVDYSAPDFRPVPNRWLITRRITSPINAPIDKFQAWIVESDRLLKLDDIDPGMDIENDFAPFVNANPKDFDPNDKKTNVIEGQAEIFIGKKTSLSEYPWNPSNAKYLPLDIMSSSNPLFADYTHHNMNVFTICDNFQDRNGNQLTDVTADYSVIGWHSTGDADPMTTFVDQNANQPPKIPTHAERLASCMLDLKDLAMEDDAKPSAIQEWLSSDNQKKSSRILCHGSMYGVKYQSDSMPKNVIAEDSGRKMKKAHPISVGSTSLDATIAYCRAHLKDDLSDPTMGPFEQDMVGLASLLAGAEGDDVEGFRAASDENLKQSFTKIQAGSKWVFKDQTAPGVKPSLPSETKMNSLLTLNAIQQTLDTANRELSDLQWAMFAKWWSFVSGVIDHAEPVRYRDDLDGVKGKIKALQDRIQMLKTNRNTIRDSNTEFEEAAADYFYQRKDPTVLFSNVGRGWDSDFSDRAKIRLSSKSISQTIPGSNLDNDFVKYLKTLRDPGTNGLPRIAKEHADGVDALLQEFYQLSVDYVNIDAPKPSIPQEPPTTMPTAPVAPPTSTSTDTDPPKKKDPPPVIPIVPYYHAAAKDQKGRDYWNSTQPWRPIMIEWEAIYYHVPMENWSFREYNNLSQWASKCVQYGARSELSRVNGIGDDRRHISGRNILTPQTSSTLAIALDVVFKNTPQKDLIASFAAARPKEGILQKTEEEQIKWLTAEQKKLFETISSLEMVSSPMTGLTSHLLTLHEGSHLKPTIRRPNRRPVPIDAAVTVLKYVYTTNNTDEEARRLATEAITAMMEETKLTPYGASVQSESNTKSPFKPVTHGQLIFTKINVIDKFGQVISAINPAPQRNGKPWNPMIPCLADSFFPGTVQEDDPSAATARPNTVVAQDTNACPFIELAPAINQPARINAHFVKKGPSGWRRCSEWDDPIWGWLVVNYADAGLQIFFADGTFYREVRLGGSRGTTGGRKYLPFDKPTTANLDRKREDVSRLEFFIAKLTEPERKGYFQGIIDMILQSLDDKQAHAPRSYATNASAIVGKPLALVNAGWSLELADPENANWSSVNQKPPEKTLLNNGTLLGKGVLPLDSALAKDSVPQLTQPSNDDVRQNIAGRVFTDDEVNSKGYSFRIKLGDSERSFDGVVGYFDVNKTHKISDDTTCDLDLDHLYTYFVKSIPAEGKDPADPRISLLKDDKDKSDLLSPLILKPYHLTGHVGPGNDNSNFDYHDAQLKVFGLIVDPFLPIHAYSAILPNKSLKLPPWTVEQALNKMTAFWQAGPLIVTQDVPLEYNKFLALDEYYAQRLAPNGASAATVKTTATTSVPDTSGTPPAGGILPPTILPDANSTIPLVSIPLAPPVGSSAGAEAVYRWLQPYWIPDPKQKSDPSLTPDDPKKVDDKSKPEDTKKPDEKTKPDPSTTIVPPTYVTRFNAMGISADSASSADAATLRMEKGPYTAIEGFIQVVKPLGTTSGQAG